MTRREFIDEITTWDDLVDFCRSHGMTTCEDLIHCNNLAEYITEDMMEFSDRYHWIDIRGWLNDIRLGAQYYSRASSFEYEAMDDGNFHDYKEDALSEGDDRDIWDEGEGSPFDDDFLLDIDFEDIIFSEDASDDEDTDLSEGEFSIDDLWNNL